MEWKRSRSFNDLSTGFSVIKNLKQGYSFLAMAVAPVDLRFDHLTLKSKTIFSAGNNRIVDAEICHNT